MTRKASFTFAHFGACNVCNDYTRNSGVTCNTYTQSQEKIFLTKKNPYYQQQLKKCLLVLYS